MEESRAKHIVNEARENLFGPEMEAVREGQQIHGELASLNPHIEMDMKEAGEHVRNGGWRLGLLFARSVEVEAGQGARTDLGKELPRLENGGKVSTNTFAHGANISRPTVTKYLNAWNLAAADGLVPASNTLSPGQSYDFDKDVHTSKEWAKYFKTPGGADDKNAFVAINNKLASFTLDFDSALADLDNQFEFSLGNLLENVEKVRRILDEGERKGIELAKKKEYRIEYHS